MSSKKTDFLYLNVRGLLERYKNPTERWRQDVYSWTKIFVAFFKENHLFVCPEKFENVNHGEIRILFSDLTDEGKDFILSEGVEKWLGHFDQSRRKNPEYIIKAELLQKRYDKFKRKK